MSSAHGTILRGQYLCVHPIENSHFEKEKQIYSIHSVHIRLHQLLVIPFSFSTIASREDWDTLWGNLWVSIIQMTDGGKYKDRTHTHLCVRAQRENLMQCARYFAHKRCFRRYRCRNTFDSLTHSTRGFFGRILTECAMKIKYAHIWSDCEPFVPSIVAFTLLDRLPIAATFILRSYRAKALPICIHCLALLVIGAKDRIHQLAILDGAKSVMVTQKDRIVVKLWWNLLFVGTIWMKVNGKLLEWKPMDIWVMATHESWISASFFRAVLGTSSFADPHQLVTIDRFNFEISV